MATYAKTQRKKLAWSALTLLFILQLHVTVSGANIPQEEKMEFELKQLVNQLQYAKYLREVLELLKGDDALKTKSHLENLASEKLSDHLHTAQAQVRSRLDEIKREELTRIRQLSEEMKRRGQPQNVIRSAVKVATKHLDLKNLANFGTEDLRRLVLEANAELSILDQRRRETFKEYEMHKILEFEELVKRLEPEEKAKVMKNRDALLADHRRQKPVSMPASKEHLMRVWEERDKLNKENFNVKTFFHLHDLDGNKFMDEYEVKVLLENEVADLYDHSALDYDPKVREEELERMREYTFNHIDLDKDHLISLDEFIQNSKRRGFDDHTFWENVKRVPIFLDEEYAAYAELNRAEINRMIDEGMISLDLSGIVHHTEETKPDMHSVKIKIDDF